jgi:hypothetical protein
MASFGGGPGALGLEPRLVGGASCRVGGDRAAVHPAHQPGAVELGDVAPDRHLGDVKLLHQVGHPDGAVGAHLGDDAVLPLTREHG